MRLILAFSCFFRLLFGAKLHPRAADYLPEGVRPALPPATGAEDAKKPRAGAVEAESPEPAAESKAEPPRAATRRSSESVALQHNGALAVLGLFQREGRLIDFLKEPIDDYDDSDIGAAARDIHRGCLKVLEEHLTLEAVMPGEEEDKVSVPKGFDPTEVRLVGDVAGDPPFAGVLRHHGWRVTKAEFPVLTDGVDRRVLAPAEVEVA